MKIDRLISIIMILLDKKRIGAKELAEKFEVSVRTIYRDIDTINMAGIPILSTPGVSGGFEIMEQYKIDKKVFSTSDLSSILTGLSGMAGMIRSDDVENAIAKVKSFIPADKQKDIELKTNQIHIDLSPWIGNRNIQSNLEIIKMALYEKKLLFFEYIDRYGNKRERTAEPYQLVLKNSHWYWQGYCRTRKDFRLFKLSRSLKLKILDEMFITRAYQLPQLDYSTTVADMQTAVTLRVQSSVIDRVLDYCSYEDIAADGSEHYLVRFPFIENDYYYGILFSFGAQCECLEPEHVRCEIKRRIDTLAAIY